MTLAFTPKFTDDEREPYLSTEWRKRHDGIWEGNPAKTAIVRNFLSALEKSKSKEGEKVNRALELTYEDLIKISNHLNGNNKSSLSKHEKEFML